MKTGARLRMIALLTVLTLLAAACGGDGEATPSDDPAALPPATEDAPPSAAGTCLAGEPDCNDIPGVGGDALPPPSDLEEQPGPATGMVVDGGLTVSDALSGDATGVIAVQGFLLIDADGARLCEALAESFPPQCGGASMPVTGYEEVLGAPLSNSGDVSWTGEPVTLLGEIVDGTLTVDPTVAG